MNNILGLTFCANLPECVSGSKCASHCEDCDSVSTRPPLELHLNEKAVVLAIWVCMISLEYGGTGVQKTQKNEIKTRKLKLATLGVLWFSDKS